ncbi:MAG: hemolysin family protein [Chloroflexi bacterium]|nr:hemolysin family protein [Chloroflexota bacterium]
MESDDLGRLILLVICLGLSAFFSSSETAFIALPRARLLHLISTGRANAKLVERLIQRPERLLATVLLSNNLVNTAAAALGTAIALSLIENEGVAVLVATGGVTLLLLIFSETLPKTVAWNRSEALALAYARPLSIVEFVLSPGVKVLQLITNLFTRMLGITSSTNAVSEGEIRTLIEVGAQTGAVEQTEAELLDKVFRFGDQQVQEIMTPRTEIVWVEEGTTLRNFLSLYAERNHTRFPVFEGDTENVKGVLSNKDVLLALGKDELGLEDSVTSLLRDAHFVPETKTVADTFSEMQQAGYGLVLTVDEFGGIAGLVTLKQMLEVIVGQVDEERGESNEGYSQVDENTYRLDASTTILQARDRFNLNFPEGDYQTVAGFILDRLGYIPEAGEIVQYESLTVTVRSMSGVRIEEVLVQHQEVVSTEETA